MFLIFEPSGNSNVNQQGAFELTMFFSLEVTSSEKVSLTGETVVEE